MTYIRKFKEFIRLDEDYSELDISNPDKYGESIGITDKSSANYSKEMEKLALPESGPIGDIVKSAWANLNVPTRGIPKTKNGNLGCAAAVSIIFYRATGLPIRKSKSREIELGTAGLWKEFTVSNSGEWTMITDWKNDSKPGDIILTSTGRKTGHVGVVVEGGKIISNSSSGFDGDEKGQIELNYTIDRWSSIAKNNPDQTASFRYSGPYLQKFTSISHNTGGFNDEEMIKQEIVLPEITIYGERRSTDMPQRVEPKPTSLPTEPLRNI